MKTFRNLIMVLGIILSSMGFTSCTAESLNDENPSASVGNDEKVKEVPEDD